MNSNDQIPVARPVGPQPPPRPPKQGMPAIAIVAIVIGVLVLLIPVLGILAAIAIPNFIVYKAKSYDAIANNYGARVSAAQLAYYHSDLDDGGQGRYSKDLNTLLNIAGVEEIDPGVTFRFAGANQNGFTFYTQHAKGRQVFTFKNE